MNNMSNKIHPSAIIESNVQLGNNIEIGPFCYISGNVTIGDNCKLRSHIVIEGETEIGNNNIFYPYVSVGLDPQDLKYNGEKAKVTIGDNNVFRENVTIHKGTVEGNKSLDNNLLTKIGNNCLFMVGAHIAHDCLVGDNVIIANNVALAGHAIIEDFVIIGGLSAVKQFIRIGKHAIIGGMSGVEKDVIPFGLVMGERANLCGLNIIGLKRRGFDKDTIKSLQLMYKDLFNDQHNTLNERLDMIKSKYNDVNVLDIINFIQSEHSNSLCKPKSND